MEAYQKLKSIFNGLTRAHGVFYKGETKDSGKVGGKAFITDICRAPAGALQISVVKHLSSKKKSLISIGKTMLRVMILVLVLSPYVMMLLALGLVLMLTITL